MLSLHSINMALLTQGVLRMTEDADAITAVYKHCPPDAGRFTYDGGRFTYDGGRFITYDGGRWRGG
jgi:hypothetical protein